MIKIHGFLGLFLMLAMGTTSYALEKGGGADRDLMIMVNVDSNNMPTSGKVGADVLIYKKGGKEFVAHKTQRVDNDGKGIKIPFIFTNLPKPNGEQDEYLIKAYGSTFSNGPEKLVDLRETSLKSTDKKILLNLNLQRVGE